MKDKNGINTECYNCAIEEICKESVHCGVCKIGLFLPSKEAYEDRIADLEKKLTETVKLLGERSRECGELEAHNEVLQRRIEEFSMELLDRTMKENKDVLERLKKAESEEK